MFPAVQVSQYCAPLAVTSAHLSRLAWQAGKTTRWALSGGLTLCASSRCLSQVHPLCLLVLYLSPSCCLDLVVLSPFRARGVSISVLSPSRAISLVLCCLSRPVLSLSSCAVSLVLCCLSRPVLSLSSSCCPVCAVSTSCGASGSLATCVAARQAACRPSALGASYGEVGMFVSPRGRGLSMQSC
jgi:hypothetical protein